MKRIGQLFGTLVVVLGFLGAVTAWWAMRPLSLANQTVDISIEPQTTVRGIAQVVADAGVDVEPVLLYGFFRLSGQSRKLRAGSYEISEGESLLDLLRKLSRGEESLKAVGLIDGWTFKQFRAALAKAPNLNHDSQGLSDAELMTRLGKAVSTLGKLSFSVSREADITHWADAGEQLLDLRVQGPFKGRGTLHQLAEKSLKAYWTTGDPETVSAAMEKFLNDNRNALLEHSPVPKADQANYREWAKKLAEWLYGTEHIAIHYSIDYDGIDIRKLSPGTRGIVLLLLYLALDEGDDRPLIIDQPEENLDPKSIFDELVGLFLAAKQKRQVILVTHNANLVVNTDADQIIVASVGPHRPGELPPISYMSGGLESVHIRKAVCDILEGGERAFQERARRLRVSLDR